MIKVSTRSRQIRATVALLLLLGIVWPTSVHSAELNWGAATNNFNASDVFLTGGGVISALNGGPSDVSVGGIVFSATDTLSGPATFTGFLPSDSTGDSNYDALLNSGDFGGGSGQTSLSIGSGLLTPGESYTLQVWYTEKRPEFAGRTMRYGDGASPQNTVDLVGSSGSFGQHVIGTFTASGTSQTLTMAPQGFGQSHFNALLLQATTPLPPPPAPSPLDPKATPGWVIDSQADWTAAYGTGNFIVQDGQVNPTIQTATFESRLQPFTHLQSFTSVTFEQTSEWNAGKWDANDGSIVEPLPGGDAPVFVSPADGDYWYLNSPSGGGNYRAYHSTDMVNWTDHGDVTGANWVTSAEYKDGTFYVYYDEANDEDPHLLTFTDLSNASTRVNHGEVFADPNWGSDMAIFRDLDGTFHLIHEDWSKINARQHSWDSQVAGHTTSPDGINGFNTNIQPSLFDEAGSPTGAPETWYNHPHIFNPDDPSGRGDISYIPHTNNDGWGDYEMIRVGDTYYLFADDHPSGGSIRLGYWYSDDINAPFTYGGPLGVSGHPDPTAGFAEGQFFIMTQNADIISDGPWVDAVSVQVGVDTDGDEVADFWTDWQDVSETYGRIDGFAKVFSVDPASIDLSSLPDGYGIQFRYRTTDMAAVMESVVFESMPVSPLLGDFNDDGVVNAADYTVWRDNLGATDESTINYAGDGIGGVDAADYGLWRANFGATLGTLASSNGPVPEPSTIVLLTSAAGFAAFGIRKRGR